MAAMNLMDVLEGHQGGLIVNISSVAGLSPLSTTPVYGACKAGVVLFTRSMAVSSNLCMFNNNFGKKKTIF